MDNEPTMPETISYSFLYGPPALAKMHGVVMYVLLHHRYYFENELSR